MKVIRALNEGRITGRLDITAAGKSDGVGAQSLARISAMCFASAYGLNYVHTSFQILAHPEMPMPEWVATWENLLLLGKYVQPVAESRLPLVDLETYAMTPSLWKTDRLLTVRHYHTFCALAPQPGEEIAQRLSTRLKTKDRETLHPLTTPMEVRLHIRRGDVRSDDAQTGHRFTANTQIVLLLKEICAEILAAGRTCRIRLYSQGESADFAEFEQVPNLELCLDMPALDTFQELVEADVLVMARSDFSHTAGMYCRGIKICDPRHRVPLPSWVKMDPRSGRLDRAEFRSRLLALDIMR